MCLSLLLELSYLFSFTEIVIFSQGVLADILEPIMGKGLIPADLGIWKQRRRGDKSVIKFAWTFHLVYD